ncbi:MAG TPA: hypothetical protein VN764_05735 [Polyangiaceae bacterium]|nr:hypothetical protein [Polyangiaceae bacterium]
MKWPIALGLGAGVVGGVAGGWLSQTALRGGPATTSSPRTVMAEAEPDEERLEDDKVEEVSALRERLRKLENRLSLVTAALQKGKGSVDEPTSAETGAEGDRPSATDVADPVFEAAVLDILDRDRTRKDEEKVTWQKQLQAERGKRYAGELVDKLGLSSTQQTEIAKIVEGHFEQLRAMRSDESPEQPTTRKEWRAARDKMNQALDDQLKAVMSADQFEKYQALDPDDQIGFGRRNRNNQGAARDGSTTTN